MLKIKLTRLGKKAEPRYRIVVNEARSRRDGQYVAQLGYYQPALQPKRLELDTAAYQEWIQKGAQPTPSVKFLFDVAQAGKGFPVGKPKLSKKAREKLKSAAAEKEATAQAAAPKQAAKPETAPAAAAPTPPQAPVAETKAAPASNNEDPKVSKK